MIEQGRAKAPRGAATVGGLAAAVLALALLAWPQVAEAAKPRFADRQLPFNSLRLFDLSVADVDGDGRLDLFSTHHRYRGALLVGQEGGFAARLDRSGLSATAHVPGFDDQHSEPVLGPAGLYIWVDEGGNTHIVTHKLDRLAATMPSRRVRGSIRYLGRGVKVLKRRGSRVKIDNDPSTQPPSGVLQFDSAPDSELVVRAQFMDLPFEISVEPTLPRQRILLGPRRSIPSSHTIPIDLGDRHGVAWADFNQDGVIDAYISNGGNRGAIRRLSEQNQDELYLGEGDGRFREAIESSDIDKGFCRGRYAAPVDYDSDGDLDIFVGCENGHPLLWHQRRPGKFGSQSELMQRAKVRGEHFRWIDLDGDGSPELVAAMPRTVRVYERSPASGRFVRRQSIRPAGLGRIIDGIAIGDHDGDLDPDVFIASRGGNALLRNEGGMLRPTRPHKLGLPPGGSTSVSFLDFDNDGRLDVHAVSQGLFRQRRDGSFKRTGAVRVGGQAQWATSSWFDLDGDGSRDLVSVIKRRESSSVRRRVYENRSRSGHWLELDLRGPLGNTEAIGARVVVEAKGSRQAGWVGQSEGSRYSSGHYRLYFGLGRKLQAQRIRVFWPDGTRTTLRDVEADQRLRVTAE
jgi:hypothetical protein